MRDLREVKDFLEEGIRCKEQYPKDCLIITELLRQSNYTPIIVTNILNDIETIVITAIKLDANLANKRLESALRGEIKYLIKKYRVEDNSLEDLIYNYIATYCVYEEDLKSIAFDKLSNVIV